MLLLVTHDSLLFDSVQICSSSQVGEAPPTKEIAHPIAWRLGFSPPPMLFTSLSSDACPSCVLEKRGGSCAADRARANLVKSLWGWACSDSQDTQGYLDAIE
jgi:hypothetical protein